MATWSSILYFVSGAAGIPVNPVDFLCSFNAFRKAIPTINTIRLCNQFGRRENAGLTKLPKELIALFRREEKSAVDGWANAYKCFEGTCRLHSHVEQVRPKIFSDSEIEDVKRQILYNHPKWQTKDGVALPERYQERFEDEVALQLNEEVDGRLSDLCFEIKHRWQSDIQELLNNDACTLLRKHFGLDPYIMHETLDSSTIKYLQRTDTRYSSRSRPEKTTICLLVLPSRNAQWKTRLDESSEDFEYYHGESVISMLVDRKSLNLTDKHQRRFARALCRLALEPSVHPSQFQKELSANSTIDNPWSLEQTSLSALTKKGSEQDNAQRDAVTTRRIKDLEQSQWPKLMFLATQTISGP
ncbi:hypothetical protein M436DRAFT_81144 [Aureobasidium namibiae CBS 147.97]|uniref:Uncharacterized protein n=1 Tax=Aureobasidium namibiae CBS 147.97 TaxID=1043004 RepID=A0A074WQ56_9PEZI